MTAVRKRGAAVFVLAGLALVSAGVGRAVVETQAIEASPSTIGLATAGVMVAIAVMVSGPVLCLAALVSLTVLHLLPDVSVGGGVDLTAADPFFVALVCWWLIRSAGAASAGVEPRVRVPLRGAAVLVLLGYIGLNLLYVAVIDVNRLPVSFVSWLRLVETASLGWFAATFLRTRRDLTVVLGAIALAGAVAIVLALTGGAGDPNAGPLGTRGGGVVNANTLGLVSGALVLMSAFGALGPSMLYRIPLGVWGVVGVVQSQSVGSIVGTSVALVLGLAFMVAPRRRVVSGRVLRALIALGVGVAIAYGVAAAVRPENLPTSQHFRDSSGGQRAVLGAAGIELAKQHPVIGVGWRRSELPEVIGAPDLNATLRERFPSTRDDFFPDVSPASVHNAYVQIAADLGLVGVALLVIVFVSLARQIARVVALVRGLTPDWAQLWFLVWSLVLIVVWWNDNPIYGGQAETVLPAIFVGAIAAFPAMVGARSRLARPSHDLLAGIVSDHAGETRERRPRHEQRTR